MSEEKKPKRSYAKNDIARRRPNVEEYITAYEAFTKLVAESPKRKWTGSTATKAIAAACQIQLAPNIVRRFAEKLGVKLEHDSRANTVSATALRTRVTQLETAVASLTEQNERLLVVMADVLRFAAKEFEYSPTQAARQFVLTILAENKVNHVQQVLPLTDGDCQPQIQSRNVAACNGQH